MQQQTNARRDGETQKTPLAWEIVPSNAAVAAGRTHTSAPAASEPSFDNIPFISIRNAVKVDSIYNSPRAQSLPNAGAPRAGDTVRQLYALVSRRILATTLA